MPRRKSNSSGRDPNNIITREFPPATSVEDRENQLISLAIDRAEQQLRDGTASAQVIVHYLKLGSTRERLERQQIEQKMEVDATKVENYKSQRRVEELYADAIKAMRSYNGQLEEEEYED